MRTRIPALRQPRLPFAVGVLVLIGAIVPALAADPGDPHPKAESLAPQSAGGRSFGTPIQAPILHRRHKQATPAATPTRSVAATPTKPKSGANAKKPSQRAVSKSTTKGVTDGDRPLPPDPAYRPPAADRPLPPDPAYRPPAADRPLPPDPAYRPPAADSAQPH